MSNVYSTDEIVVGTWINGKPIYRKTFEITWTGSGINNIPANINNIDRVVVIHGIGKSSSGYQAPIPNMPGDLSYRLGISYSSSGQLQLEKGTSSSQTSFIIIIEYTKTTD